ncbi:MAG: ester cyclase [Ilumatobacteraceae bacterium]
MNMPLTQELRDQREAIVREHMEAENRLDFAGALATFARPRYELIGTGQVYDGPEEVTEYFRRSRTPFPDQHNEIIAMHHADDAVITEFWLMGTHLGRFLGVEATGRTFRVQMAAFFLFEDAGLVNERVYFNPKQIADQLFAADV